MVLFAIKLGAFFLPSIYNLLGEDPCWYRHQCRLSVFLLHLGVGGHFCAFSFSSWESSVPLSMLRTRG